MNAAISISIDVPNLEAGVAFYTAAFGLAEKFRPVPGVAVLGGLNVDLCILEKAAGSQPSPNTKDSRKYERHWTPVHLDISVNDLPAALLRVEALGAKREQVFENPEHGSAAFCADPFGHGFCLLARPGSA